VTAGCSTAPPPCPCSLPAGSPAAPAAACLQHARDGGQVDGQGRGGVGTVWAMAGGANMCSCCFSSGSSSSNICRGPGAARSLQQQGPRTAGAAGTAGSLCGMLPSSTSDGRPGLPADENKPRACGRVGVWASVAVQQTRHARHASPSVSRCGNAMQRTILPAASHDPAWSAL